MKGQLYLICSYLCYVIDNQSQMEMVGLLSLLFRQDWKKII